MDHIKIYHYMWNYVFFIAYLNEKDKNDYTGIESYINKKYRMNDTSWFPINKASELQNIGKEEKF